MNRATADKILEYVTENPVWDAIPDYLGFEIFINSLVSEDEPLELAINRQEIEKQKRQITKRMIGEFYLDYPGSQCGTLQELIKWLNKEGK